jgi:hypothetical protein
VLPNRPVRRSVDTGSAAPVSSLTGSIRIIRKLIVRCVEVGSEGCSKRVIGGKWGTWEAKRKSRLKRELRNIIICMPIRMERFILDYF